ncbi:hypothetical protein N7449_012539 [Penicillium cf. viridicatum]|uniref:Uncharacterized protein n=1 Tax=Penicillium cf. viridicatum TaxID=2972119 RepID=A0A9W9IKW1_9EURO|nr:hypothetical protein N7449_012539 [Penicillium cf. viridicatum]
MPPLNRPICLPMPTNAHQHARGTLPASGTSVMVPPSGPRLPSSTAHWPVRRSGQLPRRANWRPMPLPGARSPAGGPRPSGLGDWDRLWCVVAWAVGVPGVLLARVHPCQGHHPNITILNPSAPGRWAPGRFYTNPPTPFGV